MKRILLLGPSCPALEAGLEARGYSWVRSEELLSVSWLEAQKIDFGVSYRYRHVIKGPVLTWFSGRLINLHISYLPWNRGADPNLWSFLTATPSGVSIHRIDEGIDTGPLLLRQLVQHDLGKETLRTSYETLNRLLVGLFVQQCDSFFAEAIVPVAAHEEGSFHRAADKQAYMHLLSARGWDTPIADLLGKATEGI